MDKNPFRTHFPTGSRAFFPVIHAESDGQVMRNVALAVSVGADGVFLINHDRTIMSHEHLAMCAEFVREAYPQLYLGLNFLGLPMIKIVTNLIPPCANGLWRDNACIDEESGGVRWDETLSNMLRTATHTRHVTYFGGVAFKGQPAVFEGNLPAVAVRAMKYVDVITTSGSDTGIAAPPRKLQVIRQAVGEEMPVALASGVTAENVDQYLPYTDAFLVASGINKKDSFTEFDETKIRVLADRIHAYSMV